jgi:hypothetical protein
MGVAPTWAAAELAILSAIAAPMPLLSNVPRYGTVELLGLDHIDYLIARRPPPVGERQS